MGLRVWFRYEKYREEFKAPGVVIAIDETPIGVFVEIEGSEADIHRAAAALGKTPQDYLTPRIERCFSRTARRAASTRATWYLGRVAGGAGSRVARVTQ